MELSFETFKKWHSEIVLFAQIIENDLKWIYAYLHLGDPKQNYDSLIEQKITFGQVVFELRELDAKAAHPFLEDEDYSFLQHMAQKRNYWCHRCALDFVYVADFVHSPEYQETCHKLFRDHERFNQVNENVERARMEAVRRYRR